MNARTCIGKVRNIRLAATVGLLLSAAWGGGVAGAQVPSPKTSSADIQLGPSCITSECHGDIKKPPFLHGPVNLGQCVPCHVPVGNKHVFQPMPTEHKKLCLTCHQQEPPKKVVHPPFASDCVLCHNPHGNDNRFFVKGGTGSGNCQTCHGDVRQGIKFLHGPVAGGECLACHSPHQSEFKGLLVQEQAALCQSCHVDVQQELKGAVSVHLPANNNCAGCHKPHGGDVKFFLVAQGQELCRKCHGDFLKSIDTAKYPHKVMTEGKGCSNCHKPHSSNQQRLLMSDNMGLCLGCHDKAIQTGNRVLPNIKQQIESSKYLHGPIREKSCIACHQAHGSEFPHILSQAFPASFYSPFSEHAYDMCFKCHDRQIVAQERTKITGFRNGDLNLHYLHTHRDKGRSCRACHSEHAANQPKHIRSSVPFGNWEMEVKYAETPTGGGCSTGCHLTYHYDREKPFDNSKAKP